MKRNQAIIIRKIDASRQNEFHGIFADGQKYQPRLYRIWRAMKCRCNTPSYSGYKAYGGRGISVCEDWKYFGGFATWAVDNGYDDNLSIERKDVNGNYEPSNCVWATPKQQGQNKRNSCLVDVNGITKSVAAWAEETGIYVTTLYRRYQRGIRGEEFIKPPKSKPATLAKPNKTVA